MEQRQETPLPSHDFEVVVDGGDTDRQAHPADEHLLQPAPQTAPPKAKTKKKKGYKELPEGGNNNNDTTATQGGGALSLLEDLDQGPVSFQAARFSHQNASINSGNFEVSLIEEIVHHFTSTPPRTIRQILLQGPENWPKGLKVFLNVVKLLINAGIPVGAAILYAAGALKFANGDYTWAGIYLFCAIGSNVLQNFLFVQETFESFLSEHERRLIGDSRGAVRRNLPLIGYFAGANVPALSSTLGFIVTSTSAAALKWFLALITQVANAFMYTFGLRSIVSGIQSSIIRRWHFKSFPFNCLSQTEHDKDMAANYLLQDRLLAVLDGFVSNLVRNRDRHNFPANLLSLTPDHNQSPFDRPQQRIYAMGIITAFAKQRGVIDRIGSPDYAHSRLIDDRVNFAASLIGFAGAVVVVSGIMGFFVSTEQGIAQIAADISWLSWLANPFIMYPIAGTINFILGGFLGRAGHSLMTSISRNAINLFRCKLELPWVMQMYPATTTGFVIVQGGVIASFSYATGVLLINNIPEGYKLMGFIPLTAGVITWCGYCAYAGVDAANGFFNIVTLKKILEALVVRLSCSPSEKQYARLAYAIDQSKALISQMDPRGIFGNEFAKLINIPTNAAHFEREGAAPNRHARATNVFEDLTAFMPRPSVLVQRASGARREARENDVLLRRHSGTLFARSGDQEADLEEVKPGMEEIPAEPRRPSRVCGNCTIL